MTNEPAGGLQRRPALAFFTPYMPYPPDTGGKNRSYNLLLGLARAFNVDLCTVYHGDAPPDPGPLAGLCRSVHALRVPARRTSQGWRQSLLSPQSFTVRAFHSPQSTARAAQVLAPFCHDLLFFDEVVTFAHHRYLPPYVPYVVSFQKVDHDFYADLARRQASRKLRLYQTLEAAKLRRYEIGALRGAMTMVVCSASDQALLQPLAPRVPALVIPNGVDVDYFSPASRRRNGPPVVLFVGTMDYQPNIDALMFFLRHIFGRVLDELPDARLVVCGRNPAPAVRALDRPPCVTITGTVDDVRPYYANAGVSVVPLRVGGGTRLKIAEAFAMGVPVVSTSVGAQGLEARPGVDLLVADEPAQFARHVVQVLTDAALRASLAANGRRLAEAHYAWPDISGRLARSLLDLLRARRAAGQGGGA